MRLFKIVSGMLVGVVSVVVIAVMAGKGKGDIYHYFQEKEALTFLSGLLLSWTALCALITSVVDRYAGRIRSWIDFWRISAAGFFYLSMDEYFMLHEGMDTPFVRWLGHNPQEVNWDGLVFVVLGVGAVWIFLRFGKSLMRDRTFMFLGGMGLLNLAGMVIFDLLNQNNSVIKVIEETFKINGVACFFMAYFVNLLDRIRPAVHDSVPLVASTHSKIQRAINFRRGEGVWQESTDEKPMNCGR